MAKPSEILTTEARQRNIHPGDVLYDVLDTTRGLTEDRREANIGDILGDALILKGADYNPEAVVPSLADVLSFYGLKDSDDKKAVDKFLESFSKKLPQWKKQALDDPKWGKSGWETIKKIYQQAEKDKMYSNIAEGRRKIAHGDDEEGMDWLATKVANIMFPRATKAIEEGRDPTASEWGRDAAANAIYAIPVSRIIGGAVKAAPAVARSGAQALGQFAAPAAVAGMDYALDPNYDGGDAATDIVIGGMTNLGANKVLGPLISNKLGAISGNIAKRGKLGKIRDILEGSPSAKEKAAQLKVNAEQILKNEEQNLSEGLRNSVAPPTKAAVDEAGKIRDIMKAPETVMLNRDGSVIMNAATGKPLTGQEAVALVEKNLKDEYLARNAEDVLGSISQQAMRPQIVGTPAFKQGAKDYAAIFRAHPELKSAFIDEPLFALKGFDAARAFAPVAAYAVNQFGSSTDRAADVVGGALGTGSAKEQREANVGRKAKEQHKAKVSEILSAPGTDAEDAKWLTIVRDNPKVLQFGYADDPEGFKRWLLERGSDLLRGTPLYRPAWEAE